MYKKGIMICGHGSRSKDAEREFGLLAKGLKKRFPNIPVEFGFLEYSAPNIHMGLDALRDVGVENIIQSLSLHPQVYDLHLYVSSQTKYLFLQNNYNKHFL